MFDGESQIPLNPLSFFQLGAEIHEIDPKKWESEIEKDKKFKLPETSELTGESPFADLSMGWCKEGLAFFVAVKGPFHTVHHPNIEQGDSVELFIDTRDVKTSGFNTRFCHHFYFLPEAVDGHMCGEITRFRTEDAHELCDPNELICKTSRVKSGSHMKIFIPSACLQGYDPEQFSRLGFTYRINHSTRASQHFSVLTEEYQIEQQPSLWSSLRLVP